MCRPLPLFARQKSLTKKKEVSKIFTFRSQVAATVATTAAKSSLSFSVNYSTPEFSLLLSVSRTMNVLISQSPGKYFSRDNLSRLSQSAFSSPSVDRRMSQIKIDAKRRGHFVTNISSLDNHRPNGSKTILIEMLGHWWMFSQVNTLTDWRSSSWQEIIPFSASFCLEPHSQHTEVEKLFFFAGMAHATIVEKKFNSSVFGSAYRRQKHVATRRYRWQRSALDSDISVACLCASAARQTTHVRHLFGFSDILFSHHFSDFVFQCSSRSRYAFIVPSAIFHCLE